MVRESEESGPEVKCKRARRKKDEVLPETDVGMRLMDLMPQMLSLRASLREFVEADEFVAAHDKRQEILALGAEIHALPVCPCCFVELPSPSSRRHGAEVWRYQDGFVVCSPCGAHALYDFGADHFQLARDSLRHRVRAEIEMAQKVITDTCDAKISRGLQAALEDLQIVYGKGRGPKNSGKQIGRFWLAGQIYRTMERLSVEPDMRKERSALLLALRAMEIR